MKITIITVTYNSASTLAATLQSVASQDYKNIEHLVIDGGSRDGTLDIVARHGQHVARTISERDKGIYDAMNKGMALATGDFIGFLNSDDILASEYSISRLALAALNADAVYGNLEYVSENDLNRVVRRWHAGAYNPNRLYFGWMPPHPTFYICRRLMQEVGNFDTSMCIAADYEYILRCLTSRSLRVQYVDDVLVKMRLGGVSNRSFKTILQKSREDLRAMRRYRVGGWGTLAAKNLSKVFQFIGQSK